MVLAFAALFALPAAVLAQPASLPRVVVVYQGALATDGEARKAFAKGMSERGYVNGKNVILDESSFFGRSDRLPEAMRELIARKPAVIVVTGSPSAHAAKSATSSIPIVVASMGDPVAQGLVPSLARPGGNITGNFILSEALGAKRLELLKELLPKAVEIGYITNLSNPAAPAGLKAVEASATRLGVRLTPFNAPSEATLDEALAAVPGRRLDALLLGADAVNRSFQNKIVATIAASRIPAMYAFSEAVDGGGLISYSADRSETYRNAARLVDRILKGAKPGDLPFEQPTKFDLVVNLKTAKALGITIPQSVLLRADRVVE